MQKTDRPDQVVLRLLEPETATLLDSSGKLTSTGAASPNEARKAIRRILAELANAGLVQLSEQPRVTVENMVVSTDLGAAVDLTVAKQALAGSRYEPDRFPCLVSNVGENGAVVMLFPSGKLVCSGVRSMTEAKIAIRSLRDALPRGALLPRMPSR